MREHIRAPRVYRGKDIEWWMDVAASWVHDETYQEVLIKRARSDAVAASPARRSVEPSISTGLTDIGLTQCTNKTGPDLGH